MRGTNRSRFPEFFSGFVRRLFPGVGATSTAMASPKDKVFAEKQFAKYAQYGEELLHIYRVTLFPPKAFDVKKNIEQCDTAKRKGVHRLIALSCYRLLVIKRGKLKQKKVGRTPTPRPLLPC